MHKSRQNFFFFLSSTEIFKNFELTLMLNNFHKSTSLISFNFIFVLVAWFSIFHQFHLSIFLTGTHRYHLTVSVIPIYVCQGFMNSSGHRISSMSVQTEFDQIMTYHVTLCTIFSLTKIFFLLLITCFTSNKNSLLDSIIFVTFIFFSFSP